ncbi:MAG TPA: A/G-specific adenine glycosylase [Burkholderiaceae bacterium]|nr:A/G-specific adenine glycosylase [Burkholderiaceae bacterium]
MSSFGSRIVAWQATHGRHDLPWQRTRDPYRVWLSEIMLQQTQVATVLDYYARFLQRFPDVRALAAAPLDDVLAAWSGLGYYSRARNLHRCAGVVVQHYGGEFPRSAATLAELPGIGTSTAAAIAGFCFGERAAILDGNVKRVLTRWLGFKHDLASSAHERALWREAEALLPQQGIEAYTQGLMDLGATLCLARKPSCLLCPVQADCAARREGEPEAYPVKTRKLKRGQRESVWLWLRCGDRLWLQQRPPQGVWAGLWSLPEFASFDALAEATRGWSGEGEALPSFTHVLTHFDWRLHPRRWTLPRDLAPAPALPQDGRWFTHEQALALGLPAPLRKLLVAA